MRNVEKHTAEHKELGKLTDEQVTRSLALLHEPTTRDRTLLGAYSAIARWGLRISPVRHLAVADLGVETVPVLLRAKHKVEPRLPMRATQGRVSPAT